MLTLIVIPHLEPYEQEVKGNLPLVVKFGTEYNDDMMKY